ncbi:hypothetical protein F8M41_012261 [Gigaspora margarita]|uniref:Uncharacterized protein n=1 Tax=Gigaspora margarita TaxID=4874 RepID=A0A8H4B3U1_GIGMA|nr:hypothetical protein F8M41_012261 [Gigaspora margarita]
MGKNTTNISTLKVGGSHSYYELQLLHGLFHTEIHGIISALEVQKESLQEVIIEYCTCGAGFKELMNCKNLEILRIRYCNDYNTNFREVWLLLQRPKLESMNGIIIEESLLLKTLKSFCPNITYLDISCTVLSTQLLELIGNLQNLQFFTLRSVWFINRIRKEELKIRVKKFAEILPLTLQYLDLRYSCLHSYIDILLNYCDASLKNLLINCIDNEKTTNALIEFSKRKRTLNCVGVNSYCNRSLAKEIERYFALVVLLLIANFENSLIPRNFSTHY